tara:strand:+ start:5899 stop:7983 length:2085 start_codon:yes stop_codon:yes gene_type:complete
MAQLIYTLIPGNTGWDFTGVNDYLDGCAIYGNCYGVSGACGTGELGGFATNTGGNCLSIGTFNSSFYVVNRTAQWLMNTTSMEYMIIDVIVGSDFNGGERPNNFGESLYIKCSTGGSTGATLVAYSGKDGGYTFPDVQGGGGWFSVTVQIPPANRGLFLWQLYAFSIQQPEFAGSGGIYSSNVNAGDRYGISRIRVYGEVPTNIQYFRGNDESADTDIFPGDPVTFSWSTALGSFATATSGAIYTMPGENLFYTIPSGNLLNGTYTVNPGPTSEQQYRLKVNGATGEAFEDFVVKMLVPDSDPDTFAFDSVSNAELSTSYTSNTVTITGLETSVTLSATNGAETSKNGGGFSTSNKTINNSDTVRVRMTSSGNYITKKTTSVSVGSASASWSITTKSEPAQIPNTFSFNDVTGADPNSIVTSNEVTITGITQTVAVSAPSGAADGFESQVNGGAWSGNAKTITNGGKLRLRLNTTTSALGDTKTTSIGVGAGAAVNWSVTNKTTADGSPNYFEFTDAVDQAASTPINSNTVTITGINVPTTVTTTNGALISIAGGAYNSSPQTITNGQSLSVRLTSSPDPGGEVETDVTVGNLPLEQLTTTWKVITTTAGDIIPDPFYFINKDDQVPNTYVESNTVLIQGITSPSPFTVTNGQASINNGPWAFTGNVSNGDTVKLRMLTPSTVSTNKSVSITIG